MTKYNPVVKRLPQLLRWEVEKFWNTNFRYNESTGCLEWTKALSRYGYARYSVQGKTFFAHRIAYFIYYGVDPCELLVRHICNNPKCCHPFHLELGTHDDNSQDMVRAGRSQSGDRHWMKRHPERFEEWRKVARGKFNLPQNGENHPATILTAESVTEIKGHIANGVDNRTLATAYGVTHSNISAIARGKSWKHIDVEMPPRVHDMSYAQKLTEEQVRKIKERLRNGESKASLARAFNIGQTAIFKIKAGITWKHIE